MTSISKNRNIWLPFVGLLLLSLIVRLFTYFPTVINHDESTYIVIANQILAGDLYFVDVIDTKPPGIFILFGLLLSLFGKSILTIRLATSLAIGLTGFVLFLIQRKLNAKYEVALASGVIYILMTSCFTFYGLSPNTEHFFVLFTSIALWGIHRNKWLMDPLFAGLAIGFGFLIKQMVAFDMLSIGLLVLFFFQSKERRFSQRFLRAGLYTVGAMLPFICVVLYYLSLGLCDTYCEYTFFVAGRYLTSPPFGDYISFFGDFFLRFLPVTLWFFISLVWNRFGPDWWRNWLIIWSGLICAALIITGKMFAHYWLQFMIPFALVAAHIFDTSIKRHKVWDWLLKLKTGGILLFMFFMVTLFIQKKDFIDRPDGPKIIANYLEKRVDENALIFTGDSHQIIYFLLGKKSPTPYIHPSLLWSNEHAQALQIDSESEISKVLNHKPQFVLAQKGKLFEQFLLGQVDSGYRADTLIQGVQIYVQK